MLEPMPRPTLAIPRLSLPVALLLCVGIVAVAEWVIHAMGHPLICKCGTVKIWYGGRGDSQMSQHLTDWYTYSHILHGIIFYWLLSVAFRGRLSVAARLVVAALIEGGWEVFENSPFIINRYRAQTVSRDPSHALAPASRSVRCQCGRARCPPALTLSAGRVNTNNARGFARLARDRSRRRRACREARSRARGRAR